MTHPIRGLYAIVDADALERSGLEVEPAAEALLAGGAKVLQLRAKGRSAAQTLAWLRALAPLARSARVPVIANDRADLAQLAGCAGVHVGQDDLPVKEVRRIFPRLLVGVSTHDLGQLAEALTTGADYVALGPIFETQSKGNPEPVVGLDVLEQGAALAASAGVPLVAIGGITESTARLVRAAGAVPAIIGALLPEPGTADPYGEITQRARRLS